MRVINVIVTDRTEGTIITADSFGIFEEQLSADVSNEAEKLYINKCINSGVDEVEAENSLEDGWCELDKTNEIVSMVWTDI